MLKHEVRRKCEFVGKQTISCIGPVPASGVPWSVDFADLLCKTSQNIQHDLLGDGKDVEKLCTRCEATESQIISIKTGKV